MYMAQAAFKRNLKPHRYHLTSTPRHNYFWITSSTSRQQSTMSSDNSSPHRHISSHHKRTKPNEKHPQFGNLPLSTSGPQECALTGSALLNTPYLNKGAGFPAEERRNFKLTGLLPQNVSTLDQQVKRAYEQYSSRQDDLAKNTFMTSLADQNEVLYFRVSFPNLLMQARHEELF
jgi:hypothetical protein